MHMNTAIYITTKQTYIDTYKGTINIVENPDKWEIPRQVGQIEVEVPIEKRTARRPKKTRFLSHEEFKMYNIKCEKCGEYDHNKKTYRNRAVVKPKK